VRLIRFSSIVLASALLRSGTAEGSPSYIAPDIEKILKRGSLIVESAQEDRHPFLGTRKDGKTTGLDYFLAEEIANQLGVSLDFRRTAKSSEEIVDKISRSEADVGIAGLSANLVWAVRVRFSKPYMVLRQTLIQNRLRSEKVVNRTPFETPQSEKKTLGFMEKSAYEIYAQKSFSDYYAVPYSSWIKMFEDVYKGEILGALTDSLSLEGYLRNKPELAIRIDTQVFRDREDPIAIALPWSSPSLLAWVDLFLDQAEKRGVLKEISMKAQK
jgi:polar amino acid transport system substrate-binding protein